MKKTYIFPEIEAEKVFVESILAGSPSAVTEGTPGESADAKAFDEVFDASGNFKVDNILEDAGMPTFNIFN